MRKIALFSFIVFYCFILDAQSQNYDVNIRISDQMVNKLLTSVGKVSSTEEYKLSIIQGTYTWALENPKIRIEKDNALFEAQVYVDSGPLKYTDKINGSINVSYNPKTNKIELKLVEAFLNIKTKFMGKERLIKTVNIADYYKTPFIFDGPLSYQEEFSFEMPDGSLKRIKAVVTDFNLSVIPHAIQLQANFKFMDPALVKVLTQKSVSEPAKVTVNDKEETNKKKKKKRRKTKE